MAKILIVEDDAVSSRQMAKVLTSAGHTCAVLGGGEGVLRLARREPPDLVILDVMMPDISGFEVCRTIRCDPELYTLPVVFVSAMDGKEEIEHGLSQGADAYLPKPVDLPELVNLANSLLEANSNKDHVDALTSLADSSGCRRELQRWISTGERFALVYAELINMPPFVKEAGEEGRSKAVRHFGRGLHQVGLDSRVDNFFVGHMGGGTFLCFTPIGKSNAFCERVRQAWLNHVEQLYASLGMGGIHQKALAANKPVLDVMFCVTNRTSGDSMTAQQMLDIVSRLRRHAIDGNGGGIHMDRRG